MKYISLFLTALAASSGFSSAEIETSYFIKESLVSQITEEKQTLSDGTKAMCYVIQTNNTPHDHEMGPWAPTHVSDGKDKAGIWLKDGTVYDIDGQFIADLAELYDDPEWNIVRADGTIRVTDTKEAFEGAAKPNVEEVYHNHVVAADPAWYPDITATFHIPKDPVYNEEPTRLGRGTLALAFNGVGFDPPAPLHMIIKAHTIAPFDHGGGHMNPNAGYHYHVANGKTKEIPQEDGHAPMIGYVLDGFPLFAHLDAEGNPPTDLDECGGHKDDIRGYHYHAGSPGSNQIIKAYRGTPGKSIVAGLKAQEHDEHHRRPPHPKR